MRISPQLFFVSLSVISATLVFASDHAIGSTYSQNNQLQVSGGIAIPSTSTSVFTNPAGLVGANKAVVLDAGAPDVWRNGTYSGGLQGGGSSFGVAAGILDRDRGGNNPLNAYYGLGVGTENFKLGVAGQTGISNSSGSTFNAGLLFGVSSTAKVGITAIGIDNGVNEWGAGVAFGVGSGVDLVFDAAADSKFNNIEVKPGIKVSGGEAALTISYGTGSREEFADGFTAGGSYQFASNAKLELQYNAGGNLSKYFASLTLGF